MIEHIQLNPHQVGWEAFSVTKVYRESLDKPSKRYTGPLNLDLAGMRFNEVIDFMNELSMGYCLLGQVNRKRNGSKACLYFTTTHDNQSTTDWEVYFK